MEELPDPDRERLRAYRMLWEKTVFKSVHSDRERSLARALAYDFYNTKTGQLNVGDEKLASFLRWSSDKVARSRAILESSGFLSVCRGNGRSKVTSYKLIIPLRYEGVIRKVRRFGGAKAERKVRTSAEEKVRTSAEKSPQNQGSHLYEEPKVKPRVSRRHFTRVAIQMNEVQLIADWNEYLLQRDYPSLQVLNFTSRNGSGYEMPCRFPPSDSDTEGHDTVIAYIAFRKTF